MSICTIKVLDQKLTQTEISEKLVCMHVRIQEFLWRKKYLNTVLNKQHCNLEQKCERMENCTNVDAASTGQFMHARLRNSFEHWYIYTANKLEKQKLQETAQWIKRCLFYSGSQLDQAFGKVQRQGYLQHRWNGYLLQCPTGKNVSSKERNHIWKQESLRPNNCSS